MSMPISNAASLAKALGPKGLESLAKKMGVSTTNIEGKTTAEKTSNLAKAVWPKIAKMGTGEKIQITCEDANGNQYNVTFQKTGEGAKTQVLEKGIAETTWKNVGGEGGGSYTHPQILWIPNKEGTGGTYSATIEKGCGGKALLHHLKSDKEIQLYNKDTGKWEKVDNKFPEAWDNAIKEMMDMGFTRTESEKILEEYFEYKNAEYSKDMADHSHLDREVNLAKNKVSKDNFQVGITPEKIDANNRKADFKYVYEGQTNLYEYTMKGGKPTFDISVILLESGKKPPKTMGEVTAYSGARQSISFVNRDGQRHMLKTMEVTHTFEAGKDVATKFENDYEGPDKRLQGLPLTTHPKTGQKVPVTKTEIKYNTETKEWTVTVTYVKNPNKSPLKTDTFSLKGEKAYAMANSLRPGNNLMAHTVNVIAHQTMTKDSMYCGHHYPVNQATGQRGSYGDPGVQAVDLGLSLKAHADQVLSDHPEVARFHQPDQFGGHPDYVAQLHDNGPTDKTSKAAFADKTYPFSKSDKPWSQYASLIKTADKYQAPQIAQK